MNGPKSIEIIKLIYKLGQVELNLNVHTHCSLEMISQIPWSCGAMEQSLARSWPVRPGFEALALSAPLFPHLQIGVRPGHRAWAHRSHHTDLNNHHAFSFPLTAASASGVLVSSSGALQLHPDTEYIPCLTSTSLYFTPLSISCCKRSE
jgi:hypothetical protein